MIGEFVFEVNSGGLAQHQFLQIIDCLRLFRVGGVTAGRYKMQSEESFLHGSISTLSGGSPSHSKFTYVLSSADATNLEGFIRDVAPLLPDPFDVVGGATPKEIAFTRYKDALFHGVGSERAITSSITALEALFLTNEPELNHRLAQRASVFLRVLGTSPDPGRTYTDIRNGYKIRSTFIHGGSLRKEDRAAADVLSVALLEYTRVCILAFFQMATPKKLLLNQLDLAMIDPARVTELQSSLAPVVYR